MSAQVISILSVGVALLGTLVVFFRWIRQDLRDILRDPRNLETRLNACMEDMEARFNTRIDSVTARIDSLFIRPGSAAWPSQRATKPLAAS